MSKEFIQCIREWRRNLRTIWSTPMLRDNAMRDTIECLDTLEQAYLALHPPVKEPKDYLGKWYVRIDDTGYKGVTYFYVNSAHKGILRVIAVTRHPDDYKVEGGLMDTKDLLEKYYQTSSPDLPPDLYILGVNV